MNVDAIKNKGHLNEGDLNERHLNECDLKKGHLTQIDILKGLAIISVILIHTWSIPFQLIIGAPFHIIQAVSVFLLISGYVGTLSYVRNNVLSLKECYRLSYLSRRFKRILIPFTIIFIVEIIIISFCNVFVFDKSGFNGHAFNAYGFFGDALNGCVFNAYNLTFNQIISALITGGTVSSDISFSEIVLPKNPDISSFIYTCVSGCMLTCLNLGACLFFGYLFFCLESKYLKKILEGIRAKISQFRGV